VVTATPVIKPVCESTLQPAGNPLAPKLTGLFSATIRKENGSPTTNASGPVAAITGVINKAGEPPGSGLLCHCTD